MNTQEHLSALPAGYRLQDYQIASVLGVGGFGITYLATDTQLGMKVAIKEYLPNTLAVRTEGSTVLPKSKPDEAGYQWGLDRFMKEAQTLARFRHPNIVRVLRFFEANGTGYTVMEYEQGQSLAEQLRDHPAPMREPELLKLLLPLLDGLKLVHEAGFLHRDIKPANIYLRADGSPVLIDFGAARQAMGSHTQNLTSVFTPGYAPFEQYFADGKQGPWTDIYALGAVLYRLVTGHSPPDAAKRIKDDSLTLASILCRGRYSAGFLHAIDQAMLMDEEARPQSIDAWLTLLASSQAPAAAAPGVPTHVAETPTVTLPGGGGATRPAPATTAVPGAATAVPKTAATRASPYRRRPKKKKRGVFKTLALLVLAVVIVGGVAKHLTQHRAHANEVSSAAQVAAPAQTTGVTADQGTSPPSAQSSLDAAADTPDASASQGADDSAVSDTGTPDQTATVSPSSTAPPPTMSPERRPGLPDRARRDGGGGLARRFAQADTNGDGYLSRAEVAAAFPRLSRIFNRIDRNHDGRLSEEEIRRAIAFQQRMRGLRGGMQR